MRRRLLHAWMLAVALLAPGLAPAHELSMAELNLRELAPGEFLWAWGTGGAGRMPEDELSPVWPEVCRSEGDRLSCAGGLVGEVAVKGVGESYSATMLRVTWLDGQRRVYTITQGQPQVQLHGAADDRRGRGEVAAAYTVLGVEHILGGIDHLLFVVCLLFLVGFERRLVWTITAFTLAHSLTLASSALGLLTLRSGPVEAVIALSIVLAACEALHRRETLTRRWPAMVAFGFGLIHGLGFAGALKEIGLPEAHLPLALLCFNVGVELGQLLTVALAYLLVRLLRTHAWARAARAPAIYAIGIVAAFWSWQRIAAVVLS
jgi:hypothetical protein